MIDNSGFDPAIKNCPNCNNNELNLCISMSTVYVRFKNANRNFFTFPFHLNNSGFVGDG